jgi:sugar phosphate isomerase/epimerase
MLTPGLVSVTFRKLSPPEIISLVTRAHLRSIEWGGDVHVPHGDLSRAREIRALTEDAGLSCPSYGSYYRLAHKDPKNPPFEKALDSAVALGAPILRIWAGPLGSDKATPAHRAAVAADARRVCALAAQANTKVSLEYHARTLTDTADSTRQLLRDVDHPNLFLHWQPAPAMTREERLASLHLALPHLTQVHVYHYTGTAYALLADIADEWSQYLSVARTTTRDHHCLLEFVRDDSPEAFLEDAATLLRLLNEK